MSIQSITADSPRIGVPTGSIMLPAIKYTSGKREWFAVTLPFNALNKFINTSKVKKKSQEILKTDIKNRFLDKKHKDDIKNYIKEEEQYTIPPITLVSYEKLTFRQFTFSDNNDENFSSSGAVAGIIFLPLDYKFECLDGNHRSVAIKELADESPEYISESHLLLNIVVEGSARKIRQDFVDVNKNAKQTTASINTLFNTRDPLASIVADLIETIDYLEETTELLATSVSKNSKDIYTINNLKNAVIEVSGFNSQSSGEEKISNKIKEDSSQRDVFKNKAYIFFTKLKNNQFIKLALENREKIPELRNESMLTSGTGIIVIARLVGYIFNEYGTGKAEKEIDRLMNYDWSRNNQTFKGKIINDNGKILNSREAINSTVDAIAREMGFSFVNLK